MSYLQAIVDFIKQDANKFLISNEGLIWPAIQVLLFFRNAGYGKDDDHTYYALLAVVQESCIALGSVIGGPLSGTVTQSLSFEWFTTFCSFILIAMVNIIMVNIIINYKHELHWVKWVIIGYYLACSWIEQA